MDKIYKKTITLVKSTAFWTWVAAFLVFCESMHITFSERYIRDDITAELWQPRYYNIRIVLVTIMGVLLISLYVILNNSIKKERNLYWLAVVFITLVIIIRYPIYSWQAEPYWETSTNILWQTYNRGPFKSLLLDDSGYWTLLPRIMAIVILFVFKQIKYAAVLLQLACCMMYIFTCAKIIKPEFDEYLSVEIRFVLALLLGTSAFLAIPDIIVAHNIAYVGGILLIICCFMNMDKVSLPILILDTVIIIMSCCSKMHLLVYLPIIVVLLLFLHKQMHRYMRVLLISTLLGNLMMILYYNSGVAEAAGFGMQTDIKKVFLTSVYEYFQTWLYFVKRFSSGGLYSGWIYNLIILISVIVVLLMSFAYKTKRTIALWCLNAVMVGNIMVNTLAGRTSYTITNVGDFFLARSVVSNRNSVLILAAMFFLVFFTLLSDGYFFRKSIFKDSVVMGIALVLLLRFGIFQGSALNTENDMNWKEYSLFFDCESYGIPAGPKDLFLLKNAKVKYWGNRELWTHNGHFATGVSQVNKLDAEEVNDLILDNESTVIAVYTQKKSLFNGGMPRILLLGRDNNILGIIDGIADKDRYSIGFISHEPVEGVERIVFLTTKGNPYPMKSEIYVVVEAPGRGLIGDAGWGQSSLEE